MIQCRKKAKWTQNSGGSGGGYVPTVTPTLPPIPGVSPSPFAGAEASASPSASVAPSVKPSTEPSAAPSTKPSTEPSAAPSTVPSTAHADSRKPAAKGTVLTDAGKRAYYVVTSANAKYPTVAYKKCWNKKAKTATIPQKVTINGVTYTVTSIAANAFKNHKMLTKVTIGKNNKTIGKNAFYGCKKLRIVIIGKSVARIGRNAFYGCGKLKKITVKTKKLTLKNVGKNAFKGIYSKASVLVPADKRKEYALLFQKRGAGKKIKIKKGIQNKNDGRGTLKGF